MLYVLKIKKVVVKRLKFNCVFPSPDRNENPAIFLTIFSFIAVATLEATAIN